MLFSVRVTISGNNRMLNICDAPLLGKELSKNDLTIKINRNYYGERVVEKNEARDLLKTHSIINMIGKETVSMCIDLGIGSKQGVKEINDVPFLLVFKM